MNNIILMTDSYKISHWKQYPLGTQYIHSYFESRGGMYQRVLFFGLQYILKKYLVGEVVSFDTIAQAQELLASHFGNSKLFNEAGWLHIIKEHNGKLPVEIRAIPEGTLVKTSTALFVVENTCQDCFWLTSYLETLLEQVWYPCTVATKSYFQKQVIKKYLQETGDDAPDFKLHDFGYRGSTSQESAAIGCAAHLVNFSGTDTLAGISLLRNYYHAQMPAFSVPAAEHSTITAWGKDNEISAFKNMLEQFPTGIVAVVSDSYDIFNATRELWGKQLKDMVEKRNGLLVIRPDSGDPKDIVPAVLEILGESFGFTKNEKGYNVLPPFIRVIQGDGIDEKTLPEVLAEMKLTGWSADNITFGSGGGLLQNVTRDTMKFAYKCSNIVINGESRPVSKNPITDPGKKSKSGKQTTDEQLLVFKNGNLMKDYTLEEIRWRSNEF